MNTSLVDLNMKKVVVVGESNTAMDCARSSIRLGAESVTVVCPCDRKDMSARNRDVNRALDEGVVINFMSLPVRLLPGAIGTVKGLEYCASVADAAAPDSPPCRGNRDSSPAQVNAPTT